MFFAPDRWNPKPDVQWAVGLLDEARKAKVASLGDFIWQDGLFSKDNYSPEAVVIAKALKTSKSADVTAAARQYTQDAAYTDKGAGLMGRDAPTPKESFAPSFAALQSGAQSDAAKVMAAAKAQKTVAVGGSGTSTVGDLVVNGVEIDALTTSLIPVVSAVAGTLIITNIAKIGN